MNRTVRSRRNRDYEDLNYSTRSTLLGHKSEKPKSPIYGDFDHEISDGFAYSRGDYLHGNTYKRHRPVMKRIMIGSLTLGMIFYVFGSSSSKAQTPYTSKYRSTGETMESNLMGTSHTSKKSNGSSKKEPPIPDLEADPLHRPVVQPRRFQKTIVAKPIPMPIEGESMYEKPKDVSGYLIYGSSNSDSSSTSSTKSEKITALPPPLASKRSKNAGSSGKHAEPPPIPPHFPLLRSTKKNSDEPLMASTSGNNEAELISVLYYAYDKNADVSEVPPVLYDSNGYQVALDELEGKELVVEHPPPPPPPTEPEAEAEAESTDDEAEEVTTDVETTTYTSNATHSFFSFPSRSRQTAKMHINPSEWESIPQAQDQMIIISTVATMALLVGALSARRLRSRHFLSSCIENESLEDELAYDTAYTTTGTGHGGGYDTFTSSGSTGGLPWRGDLEKFDV